MWLFCQHGSSACSNTRQGQLTKQPLRRLENMESCMVQHQKIWRSSRAWWINRLSFTRTAITSISNQGLRRPIRIHLGRTQGNQGVIRMEAPIHLHRGHNTHRQEEEECQMGTPHMQPSTRATTDNLGAVASYPPPRQDMMMKARLQELSTRKCQRGA